MKNLLICLFSLLFSFNTLSCQERKSYPQNTPPGIWNTQSKQWVAHFELPADWEKSIDQANLYRQHDITFQLERLDKSSPDQAAQNLYDHLYCEHSGQKDPFINCELGFQMTDLQLASSQGKVISYFGSPLDSSTPLKVIFLEQPNYLLRINIEGQADLNQLNQIIPTLTFRLEQPQLNDSDKKGL